MPLLDAGEKWIAGSTSLRESSERGSSGSRLQFEVPLVVWVRISVDRPGGFQLKYPVNTLSIEPHDQGIFDLFVFIGFPCLPQTG